MNNEIKKTFVVEKRYPTFENLDNFKNTKQLTRHIQHISKVLNREIDLRMYLYLVANWRGFCIAPYDYSNLDDIINRAIDETFNK